MGIPGAFAQGEVVGDGCEVPTISLRHSPRRLLPAGVSRPRWLAGTGSEGVANQAPTADAGDGYTGPEGSPIALDGSGSSDPDGSFILYEWDTDDDGDYGDALGVAPDATFHDNGSYTVTLRVTDFNSAKATNSTQVVVGNVPPTVEAGPDVIITEGEGVVLDLASYSDPGSSDTHTASVIWGDGSAAEAVIASRSEIEGFHIYSVEGDHTVELCVTDDDGAEVCDSFTVKVEPYVEWMFLPSLAK